MEEKTVEQLQERIKFLERKLKKKEDEIEDLESQIDELEYDVRNKKGEDLYNKIIGDITHEQFQGRISYDMSVYLKSRLDRLYSD